MKRVYCIECGHCKYEGSGVYSCLAPENQIEKIDEHNWLKREKRYYAQDKHPSELNKDNDCLYFEAGETQV